jgi:hypothetical protein
VEIAFAVYYRRRLLSSMPWLAQWVFDLGIFDLPESLNTLLAIFVLLRVTPSVGSCQPARLGPDLTAIPVTANIAPAGIFGVMSYCVLYQPPSGVP